jgi:AraC family transcriptional regulator
MDGAAFRTPVDTLSAMEQTLRVRPVYRVANSTGTGLFAAKWKLDGFRLATGGLPHGILVYRTSGTAPVMRRANGQSLRKRPPIGSVTFASADTRAEWSSEGSCEALHVYIGPDVVRRFVDGDMEGRSLPRIKDFFAVLDPWLKGYFQMLISEFEIFAASGQPPDSLFLSQTEHLLIQHLVRWHSEAGPRELKALRLQQSVNPLRSAVMHRVQEYVDANLAREIRLHDLAAIACVSTDHFVRAFRAASGTTPYHYVLEQRMKKACFALKNTSTPISRVAVECGFNTLSHLSSTFRARLGVSPSRYRAAVEVKG